MSTSRTDAIMLFIPVVWQVQRVMPTLFYVFCGMALESGLSDPQTEDWVSGWLGNGSVVTFELTDRICSVRLVVDSGGNVVETNNYDAFGLSR
jgi:hypothetical protein